MGELESGCPAQVMVTDILSGKSTAVLRRNIDPLPFANGKMALLGRTDNNMVPNHFPGISDKGRKHIETVRPVLLLQFISCEGSQSGKHVNIGHQLVGYAARRNPARPADNHRNAMPAFPSSELETKKLAVDMVSCLPSSLPSMIQHSSVVTGEDEQSISRQPFLIEGTHNLAYHPVQFMD